jgi:hypothetical protein
MKKSLRKLGENLRLREVKGSFLSEMDEFRGLTIEDKLSKIVKEKLGLKQFEVEIGNDFNCFGIIYRYATIRTKHSSLTFRFLEFRGDSKSYELPKELI